MAIRQLTTSVTTNSWVFRDYDVSNFKLQGQTVVSEYCSQQGSTWTFQTVHTCKISFILTINYRFVYLILVEKKTIEGERPVCAVSLFGKKHLELPKTQY